MASVVELPGQKCETIYKSVIHILKPHGMPYSKMPKNVEIGTWNLSFWTYYMKIGKIGHSALLGLIVLQTLQVTVLDFVFDESKILNKLKANDWTWENYYSTTQYFWPRASAQGLKSLYLPTYVVGLVLSFIYFYS